MFTMEEMRILTNDETWTNKINLENYTYEDKRPPQLETGREKYVSSIWPCEMKVTGLCLYDMGI